VAVTASDWEVEDQPIRPRLRLVVPRQDLPLVSTRTCTKCGESPPSSATAIVVGTPALSVDDTRRRGQMTDAPLGAPWPSGAIVCRPNWRRDPWYARCMARHRSADASARWNHCASDRPGFPGCRSLREIEESEWLILTTLVRQSIC
jgi:hypothetical protein